MNRLDLFDGGFPLSTETLDFLQGQSQMAATLTALGGSDTYILSGTAVQGTNVTDGMIVYKGEVLPFKGGAIQTQVTIIETKEAVTYQADDDGDGLGDSKSAYVRRYAEFGSGGVVTFLFSELKPFVYGVANQMFTTFFKDVRLPYVGAISDIPEGWELCEILSGSFPVVYDATNPDYNQILKTGGANKVTLTEAQMPTHNHTGTTNPAGKHKHGGRVLDGGSHNHSATCADGGRHKHTGTTTTSGGHYHSFKNGYFAENYTGGVSGDTYLGTGKGGSGKTDRDNRYMWYRNDQTTSTGNHNHSIETNNSSTHSHTITVANSTTHRHGLEIYDANDHTHNFTTQSKGGGQAHENRPFYKVIALIKYVGFAS